MKTVYMSFSTDMLHSGHIAIIEKAAALGQLTIGVLTDQVIASYKRYPLLSYEERVNMLQKHPRRLPDRGAEQLKLCR